jgi:hypothetical protein
MICQGEMRINREIGKFFWFFFFCDKNGNNNNNHFIFTYIDITQIYFLISGTLFKASSLRN